MRNTGKYCDNNIPFDVFCSENNVIVSKENERKFDFLKRMPNTFPDFETAKTCKLRNANEGQKPDANISSNIPTRSSVMAFKIRWHKTTKKPKVNKKAPNVSISEKSIFSFNKSACLKYGLKEYKSVRAGVTEDGDGEYIVFGFYTEVADDATELTYKEKTDTATAKDPMFLQDNNIKIEEITSFELCPFDASAASDDEDTVKDVRLASKLLVITISDGIKVGREKGKKRKPKASVITTAVEQKETEVQAATTAEEVKPPWAQGVEPAQQPGT